MRDINESWSSVKVMRWQEMGKAMRQKKNLGEGGGLGKGRGGSGVEADRHEPAEQAGTLGG